MRKDSSGSTFGNVVSAFSYAPAGKVSYKLFGNCVSTTYTYDANHLSRLTNILTFAPASCSGSQGFSMAQPHTAAGIGAGNLAFVAGPRLALAPFGTVALDTLDGTT